MTPHPYQQDCLDATERGFAEFTRLLDVLPTGAGKTVIFSWLAQRRAKSGERTLVLAHRDELITQAADKLERATDIKADREQAGDRASLDSSVVVASVQTLMRPNRIARWPKDHFGLIISDEAHRILAPSWLNTLNYFTAQHLGVTATPGRSDQKDLGSFFQKKAYEISLQELISQGYLSRIIVRNLPLKIDLSEVKCETNPDFGAQDFSRKAMAVRLEQYLPKFAECLAEYATFRRTLVFAPLIDTARKGVEACRDIGLNADFVYGEDPERSLKLERFRNREIDYLWNADLLKEGYDDPGIDCVSVFRPTRIHSLYWQMIGRGTRIHPGKENLLILDCLYLNADHPPAGAYCLVAKDDFEAEQIREMSEGKGMPPDFTGETDLLDLKIEAENQREKALIRRLEQVKANDSKLITPEEFAILHKSLRVAEYANVMPADNGPVTEGQRKFLEQVRVHPQNGSVFVGRYSPRIAKPLDLSRITTVGQASEIISVCSKGSNKGVAMASAGQRFAIKKRLGYDPGPLTAHQARQYFAGFRKSKQREMAI